MKKKWLLFIISFLILNPATPVFADLVEDPEEDTDATLSAPQKQPVFQSNPGLIHDDGPRKPQTPAAVKPKDKEERVVSDQPRKSSKSEKPADKSSGANVPVKFWSKGLSGEKDGGVIILEEDVVVTQADMRIEADKATLHIDRLTNEVIDCVAVGNVVFARKDPETGRPVTATSREAVFNNRERTVVLKGDPKLIRGGDVVRGRQITYDLVTGWVKADRVEGVVQPTKQTTPKTEGKAEPAKSPEPTKSPTAGKTP